MKYEKPQILTANDAAKSIHGAKPMGIFLDGDGNYHTTNAYQADE